MECIKCPVCGGEARPKWEAAGAAHPYFIGDYFCPLHEGSIRASGYVRDGQRTVLYFHPACPDHGTDHVVPDVDRRLFYCGICGRRMEIFERLIVTVTRPFPEKLQPVTWFTVLHREGGTNQS